MNRPAAFPIAPGTADAEVMLRILRERRDDHIAALISPGTDERRSDLLRGRIAELDDFIDWLTPTPD
ncbi:MAG: hypothetical protein II007_13405 [Gammaproteobacteria bacterium]|nr:hypothetical protein [Gammaproteobacteria bacterium]